MFSGQRLGLLNLSLMKKVIVILSVTRGSAISTEVDYTFHELFCVIKILLIKKLMTQ